MRFEMETPPKEPAGIEREILQAVRETRYGSVEVTIQNFRIVQIERKEKRRYLHNGATNLT